MIRYSTSNDRKCRLVRNWCKENGYAYSFDDKDRKNTDTYPFVILAPLYAEKDLLDVIETETRR